MASTQPNPPRSKGFHTMMEPTITTEEPYDFSLVLGGPIFQFFRRSHLAGDGLELVNRRLLIITLVAWLPLLLLATFGSSAGTVGRLSFLHDVEVHVRFLIALLCLVQVKSPVRRCNCPSKGPPDPPPSGVHFRIPAKTRKEFAF